MKNARFWTWLNDGWVKITLKPGQELGHYECHHTEEGWASNSVRWTHEGGYVRRETQHDGLDCDGRSGGGYECECSLDDLAVIETDDGTMRPDWQACRNAGYAYDQYAEIAGY